MNIEFFGVGGPGQIGNLKKTEKVQPAKKLEGAGEDKVEFSSILQDVNRAKAAEGTADSERAARVEELKAQIQNGSYEPDLQRVSTSLLQFLVEGK